MNVTREKFQIASDLHIEYMNEIVDPLDFIVPCADHLILAGDIGSLYRYDQLFNFLNNVSKYFTNVLYIPGNHEYYKPRDMKIKPLTFNKLNDILKIIEDKIPNLYVLNCKSVIIDNVCIFGCTLWSNITCDLPKFIVRIHQFDTQTYLDLHKSHVQYIENMIGYCKSNGLTAYCVTHHPPTFDVINMANRKQKFVSLYASELDRLLTRDIHTWVFGHVHKNFDLNYNGCRLVSNQQGRAKDNVNDFSNCFTV